jgi:hypothetical protein
MNHSLIACLTCPIAAASLLVTATPAEARPGTVANRGRRPRKPLSR